MNLTIRPTPRDKKILKYVIIVILTITVISYWFGNCDKPINTNYSNLSNTEQSIEMQNDDTESSPFNYSEWIRDAIKEKMIQPMCGAFGCT